MLKENIKPKSEGLTAELFHKPPIRNTEPGKVKYSKRACPVTSICMCVSTGEKGNTNFIFYPELSSKMSHHLKKYIHKSVPMLKLGTNH